MRTAPLAAVFGARLRQVMAARGLSTDDLVRKSKVLKGSTLQRWQDGSRFPRTRSLIDLANAMGIPIADLIADLDLPMRVRCELETLGDD